MLRVVFLNDLFALSILPGQRPIMISVCGIQFEPLRRGRARCQCVNWQRCMLYLIHIVEKEHPILGVAECGPRSNHHSRPETRVHSHRCSSNSGSHRSVGREALMNTTSKDFWFHGPWIDAPGGDVHSSESEVFYRPSEKASLLISHRHYWCLEREHRKDP